MPAFSAGPTAMISDKRTAGIAPNSLKQKNAGKVQFNAVREEVFALLDKGYNRRALHAVLRERSLFTGSYRRFCEYVQGIESRERGKEKPEPVLALPEKVTPPAPAATAPTAPPPASRQEKPAAGGFVHSAPNHSDLF